MSRWNAGRRGSEHGASARSPEESVGPTGDLGYGSHFGSTRPSGAHCRECGATVVGESKFCPHCGTRMQEVCFACGALSAAGAKFCGDCGADLVNGLETQVTLFEEKLAEARQLLDESGYGKIVELLLPLTGAKHPILARYATEARELIARSRTIKSEKEEEARLAFEQAEAARKQCDYHRALTILEEVESQFRTEAIEESLGQLGSVVEEIDRLSVEITDRGARKDGKRLLAKVERLLELQPEHAVALHTAAEFRDFAHRQAQERLSKGQHDQAAQVLELVPKAVATDETHDLRYRAHEFGSLQWDLLHAPTVDATLVDVGRRLSEMSPENPRFKELHDKLSRFAARHAETGVLPPTRWVVPPEESSWGCPIEWLTGFGDVEIAGTVDSALLARFAGSFFPAFGLALQGLEKAAIGIAFPSSRKTRGLGLKSNRSAWGIDLSPGGLKAVRLDVHKKDDRVVIGACDLVEHRKPLSQASGPDERQQLMAETIAVFRKRVQGKLDRVCVCLPDMRSIVRNVRVPPANAEKLAEVMRHEARAQLAQLPEDLVWDYQAMEPVDETSPHRQRRVLLVAIRKSILQMWLDVLQSARLKIDQVQVDWLATANSLIHLGHLQPPEATASPDCREALAVLDVGSETSLLLLQRPGSLDVRPIRIGGYSFTRALVHEFRLALAEAEDLKRDPRSLELLSRFEEAIRPVAEDLVRDVQAGLTAQSFDEKPLLIRRLLAVGGGMRLHGLWRYLLFGR